MQEGASRPRSCYYIHIFCLACAQRAGATSNESSRRLVCPACHSQLSRPDDAVITELNPTEDYKTSVLSGLGPNIIMECAGRALSFWAYQTAQDICYQQYLCKTLTEKCTNLSHRLDRTVNDANSEIERMQQKLENMQNEQEALRRKNEELAQLCREKSRRLLQTEELYDKVKRKVEMGQIQRAASDAVDSTLLAATEAVEATASGSERNERVPAVSLGVPQRLDFSSMNTSLPRSRLQHTSNRNQWHRLSSTRAADDSSMSLNDHPRQRLPNQPLEGLGELSAIHPSPIDTYSPNGRTFIPHAPSFTQGRHRLSGLGLTSGLKVSQPTNPPGLGISWDKTTDRSTASRQ